MRTVKAGLIGLGTIGTGVARLLLEEGDSLARKVGVRIELKRIADVNPARRRALPMPAGVFTTSADRVITDPEIEIAIELIGGLHPAKEIVLTALRNGKHVVTANKALLATYGSELFETALKHQRCISFEASVGGGIPIISAIRDGFVANKIESVFGIVNGTTNYILTQMTLANKPYEQALAEAQRNGYAERDPHADVSGLDSTHKLAILARLCFDVDVDYTKIYREGIDHVFLEDIQDAKSLGYTLKLLAIGKKRGGAVELRVHPTLLPDTHPLSAVSGVFNAICVNGNWVGETMLYGRGAGQQPTTSAVVADIVDVALGRAQATFLNARCFRRKARPAKVVDMEDVTCRYFLRFTVVDKPGVLAQISGVLGKEMISIAAVVQPERFEGNLAPLVLMTHPAPERSVRRALRKIDKLKVVRAKSRLLRVEG